MGRLIRTFFVVGNTSSSSHNTTNASPTVARRSTLQNRLPPLPRRLSSDTQGTAPPPYAPQDPEPATPPAVPPRDLARLSPTNRNSNSALRQSASAVASRSPPTTRAPPTSQRSRPRSDPSSTTSASSAARARRPQSGATPPPPPTPAANVGGFRAEMVTAVREEAPAIPARHNGARTTSPIPVAVALPTLGSSHGVRTKRKPSVEDPLEYLRRYDTVFVVDDSSSMEGPRWFEARDALAGLADIAARYDSDGVDVHFLNSERVGKGTRSGAEVKRLFDSVRPQGITPTGEKLEELLLDYLLQLEAAKTSQLAGDDGALKRVKPVNYLVITDGEATDDPGPVIVQAAKRLDEGHFPLSQVGIQFIQIGNDDAAAQALQELDDDLAATYGIRDMVDTYPYTAEGSQLTTENLAKILLGGINRRQDRRKTSIG